MTEQEYRRIEYRKWYLPKQLDATYRKIQHLEREAQRIGLGHLVKNTADPTRSCAPVPPSRSGPCPTDCPDRRR